ncbi:MAG: Ig-like domain-containing protein, partial [Solirubrobacteraceae bacterium]
INQPVIGNVDEVAVYPSALSAARIDAHFKASAAGAQSPPPASGARPTTTSVSCTASATTAFGTDTCTATVGDVGAAPASTPTGTVKFAANAGVFSAGDTCTLQPSGSRTDLASCTVQYVQPATGPSLIAAAYSGDGAHATSSGGTGSPTSGVRLVCDAFYIGDCVGKLPAPDPLQICVSAWEHCSGFGGSKPAKPGTIDMSGFPAQVKTPVKCVQAPTNPLVAHTRQPHAVGGGTPTKSITDNPQLDCKMNTYFNDTTPAKTKLDAEVEYELNYELYTAQVQREEATIGGDLLASCTDPRNPTPDPVSCRSQNSFILIIKHYLTRLFALRSVVEKGVPVQDVAPDQFVQLSMCDQFVGAPTDPGLQVCQDTVQGVNSALISAFDFLRRFKHVLGVDVPFVAPKAKSFRMDAGIAAASRPRFHPSVRVLASGSLSLRQGRRGTLVIRFSRQARSALRRARRAGVKQVRVTAVINVEIQAGRHTVHRIPLTLLLVRRHR